MNEEQIKTAVVNQITPRHLFDAVLVIVAALILHAYISSSNNVTRFNQASQDAAPIHAQAETNRQTANTNEATNQNDLAKALVEISKQKNQPIATQVDYDRISAMIESKIGGHANVQATPGLPDAPSATVSAPKLRDYISDCDEKEARLKSCKQSVIDTKVLLDAEVTDHAATKAELKSAKLALKGGTFWQRLRHDKNVAIGGAVVGATAVVVVKVLLKH
jgi:hypothetical protein